MHCTWGHCCAETKTFHPHQTLVIQPSLDLAGRGNVLCVQNVHKAQALHLPGVLIIAVTKLWPFYWNEYVFRNIDKQNCIHNFTVLYLLQTKQLCEGSIL